MMDNTQLAAGMLQLNGEICTLRHQRDVAGEAKRRGFMQFREWPSGHWTITEKGQNFLADQGGSHNGE